MNKTIELIIVTVCVLMWSATGAAARGDSKQVCQTKADPTTHSAWRTVDGKRCWYRGERGKPREDLTWGEHKTRTVKRTPGAPRTHPPKERVEVVPLPPVAPPKPLTEEDLTARLNYYFAVLSSQTYLSTPSGALPLAMAGPWLGTPIPPGLQPVPPAPAEWTNQTPTPPEPTRSWSERFWARVWHYCCAWAERKTNP